MGIRAGIISGTVRDAAGKSVTSARVYFVDGPVPLPDVAALTNDRGEFALSVPAPGRYRVAVAVGEAAPHTIEADVAPHMGAEVEIQLPPPRQ